MFGFNAAQVSDFLVLTKRRCYGQPTDHSGGLVGVRVRSSCEGDTVLGSGVLWKAWRNLSANDQVFLFPDTAFARRLTLGTPRALGHSLREALCRRSSGRVTPWRIFAK